MTSARMPFGLTRVMSLSAAEFEASISKLGPHTKKADGSPVFALKLGCAKITYTAAPSKTLGGLLALPQAIVSIAFEDTTTESEAQFLDRFDIAFQRGGG